MRRSRDYDVKSKVSFSDKLDLIDVESMKQKSRTVKASININQAVADDIDKHSIVPSMTNSDFIMSSPEPMKFK